MATHSTPEDRPPASPHEDLARLAPAAVVETANRCYRILDGTSGDPLDPYTQGRLAGYKQTLSLLLGVETRDIARLLKERAL